MRVAGNERVAIAQDAGIAEQRLEQQGTSHQTWAFPGSGNRFNAFESNIVFQNHSNMAQCAAEREMHLQD